MSSEPLPTRTRILKATLGLVQKAQGPLTMAAIAREAGLSRQALYLTFADKADLFIALLRHVDGQRGLVQELARVRDAATGVDALLAVVDLQSRLNPDYKPVVDAFELLRRQDPAAQAAWEDRLYHRLAGARAIAGRLAGEGRLRPELDASSAADLILTLTSAATWDDLVTRGGWTAEQYRERMSALLLTSLTV